MKRRFQLKLGFPVVLLVVFCVSMAAVSTSRAAPLPLNRTLLILYDSKVSADPTATMAHRFLELPFNHKGYQFHFHDVRTGLPQLEQGEYAAILTWFRQPLEDSKSYFTWAINASERGYRFLIIGDIGLSNTLESFYLANEFVGHLGIKLMPRYHAGPLSADYEIIDKELTGFERPLPTLLPSFEHVTAGDAATEVHLSARFNIGSDWYTSALYTSHPGGVFIQSGFAFYYDEYLNLSKWIIDPFALVDLLMDDAEFPIPDTTTLAGRRIFFSHVDGDGWNNVSLIDRFRDQGTIAAEIMLKELVEPYPDLPVTVGLVTGDLDPEIGGAKVAGKIARELYAKDQVELASHTHTHPFYWSFFKKYDRKREEGKIDENKRLKDDKAPERLVSRVIPVMKPQTGREHYSEFIAGGAGEMPRAYMRHPFDLNREIPQSLKLVESLAPEGRKAKIVLWSGDTSPFESAVKATRDAGVENLNGGDTRLDLMNPSLLYVSPISRTVGNQRQIYTAASNENTYTENWTGYHYAFANLKATVKNTGAPRRVKPYNLYYHMFAVERESTLKSLKSHLDDARYGEYIPITASHYAKIADAFFDVSLTPLGKFKWLVENHHELSTFRFDDADNITIDWDESQSVIGQTRANGSLYILVDPAKPTAVIALKPTRPKETPPPAPYLDNARWEISSVEPLRSCGLSFSAEGFGKGDMLWKGLAPGDYTIRATPVRGSIWEHHVSVADEGVLKLSIDAEAQHGATVSITCETGADTTE
ncbi:polysaccharide deacetylase family protein [Roseibium sp.]|uniref:polysaccharide deacetylase family protein n=1 Tax=Roseibium sp. TaxID=1936156 RepID=UPI003A98208E